MIGKCPYCKDGTVKMDKKPVHGKMTKVYSCSNVKITTEDGECFEHVGSCRFRIWGSALNRYGKRSIGEREVRRLLCEGQTIVMLHDRRGNEYQKYAIPHAEYGIEVLFNEEVEECRHHNR